MNDSSTGGYLAPIRTGGELEDQNLRRLLQSVVVGITGMSGSSVRQRWQLEPAALPPVNSDWVAVGYTSRKPDTFAYETHVASINDNYDLAYDIVQRHEIIEVLCSFYGPNADMNVSILLQGFVISQNHSALKSNGLGFVSTGDPVIVPAMLNNQWTYGVDVPFTLRRAMQFDYPVRSLAQAEITVNSDDPVISITAHITPGYGVLGLADAPYGK